MSRPKPANPALSISDADLVSALAQIGTEIDNQPLRSSALARVMACIAQGRCLDAQENVCAGQGCWLGQCRKPQRVRFGSRFNLTKNGQTIGRRSLTNAVIIVPGKTALRPRRG